MTVDTEVVFKVIELLLLPFAYYLIKRLDILASSVSDIADLAKELKTILIGADGKNGIRSRVIRLERKTEMLSLQQASRHGEQLIAPDEEDD